LRFYASLSVQQCNNDSRPLYRYLGAALCIEPQCYQAPLTHPLYEDLARYIQESERIRGELRDTIFTGDYLDTLVSSVRETPIPSGQIHWRVHANLQSGKRAIVVVNASPEKRTYTWGFLNRKVKTAWLYEPFCARREVEQGKAVAIPGERFQVIVEE
jgi:hypothetical protein